MVYGQIVEALPSAMDYGPWTIDYLILPYFFIAATSRS